MKTEQVILKLYTLYTRAIHSSTYVATDIPAHQKTIENFLTSLEKKGIHRESLGLNFFYDYFAYTYNYWQTRTDRENYKLIKLSWILGPKQLKMWDNRIKEFRWSYNQGVIKTYNLPSLGKLKDLWQPKEINEADVRFSEDNVRKRLFNTTEGLINCLSMTSMITPKSVWCDVCKYREVCINHLINNDKVLAIKRGYIKL